MKTKIVNYSFKKISEGSRNYQIFKYGVQLKLV